MPSSSYTSQNCMNLYFEKSSRITQKCCSWLWTGQSLEHTHTKNHAIHSSRTRELSYIIIYYELRVCPLYKSIRKNSSKLLLGNTLILQYLSSFSILLNRQKKTSNFCNEGAAIRISVHEPKKY